MAFSAGADQSDTAAALSYDPPTTIKNCAEPANKRHQHESANNSRERKSDDRTRPDVHAFPGDPFAELTAPLTAAPRRRVDRAERRLRRNAFRLRHAISPESHIGLPQFRKGAVIGSIISATIVKRRRRILAVARKKAKKRNSVPIRKTSSPEAITPK